MLRKRNVVTYINIVVRHSYDHNTDKRSTSFSSLLLNSFSGYSLSDLDDRWNSD